MLAVLVNHGNDQTLKLTEMQNINFYAHTPQSSPGTVTLQHCYSLEVYMAVLC